MKEHFPVLGIKEFQYDLAADDALLYHEIHGERFIEKPHKHDFFVFLLFETGSGTHSIDFLDHEVRNHQMHLLFPDQVHRWELGADTSAYQLMISRSVFESFANSLMFSFAHYRNHPVIHLNPEVFQKLLYEFKAIQHELNAKPVLWDIVNLRSRIIAGLVNHEAEIKFNDLTVYKAKPGLFKFLSLIDLHFKEEKSVTFYADKLNITANYLNILCKRHFNASASQLIQNRVILEAKRLLHASEKSVKEIAFELGFYDLAYFSRFFKAQTGTSPRQFRE
ncbi:AraC family transcriptional regulator [Pedobacter africanus]|uniref:AraC-type DNA-binding protein n=1 Tax=Pedobacter africanus TaxID=151894 RepID=A0A1W1ZDY7_9SPHI|nr:helix-turn-helix transcriptional regulator [Pedobacter africanus]SMC46669.1 AraC-type DNA-binding protein [Pedobacter africanus]